MNGLMGQKIMREEYDLKKLKVKRHGLSPGLQTEKDNPVKVRITIALARRSHHSS